MKVNEKDEYEREKKMLRERDSPRTRRIIKGDNDIRGKRMESEEYGLAN